MFDNVRRVVRQVVTYGTAEVALQIVNFLLLPLYTRVLTPSEYGALGVLLAWEAGLKIVFRWGLEGSFLRLFYDQKDDRDRRTLAGTITIFLAIANGAILIALAAASGALGRWFGSIPTFQLAFV